MASLTFGLTSGSSKTHVPKYANVQLQNLFDFTPRITIRNHGKWVPGENSVFVFGTSARSGAFAKAPWNEQEMK